MAGPYAKIICRQVDGAVPTRGPDQPEALWVVARDEGLDVLALRVGGVLSPGGGPGDRTDLGPRVGEEELLDAFADPKLALGFLPHVTPVRRIGG